MSTDLKNGWVSVAGLYPQAFTGTSQGTSNDFSNGYVNTCMVVNIGTWNATSVNIQCEESANGSSGWTAISGMVVTATTSNTQTIVEGQRQYRYVRANVSTFSGTSVTANVDILAPKKYVAASASVQGGYSRSPST